MTQVKCLVIDLLWPNVKWTGWMLEDQVEIEGLQGAARSLTDKRLSLSVFSLSMFHIVMEAKW